MRKCDEDQFGLLTATFKRPQQTNVACVWCKLTYDTSSWNSRTSKKYITELQEDNYELNLEETCDQETATNH